MSPLALSFASPGWLVAVLLVPLLVGAHLVAQRRRSRYALRFPALGTLVEAVGSRRSSRGLAPLVLFAAGLVALVLAVAKPEVSVAVPEEQATVVLVTDVSRSMRADDVNPSRLSAAQGAAEQFLEAAPAELRVGLVAFSDAAETVRTPTTDRAEIRDGIASLNTQAGTATGAGLETALRDIARQRRADGARTPAAVVLLSDGAATDGEAQFQQAAAARRAGIPISTVALGTASGSVLLPDGRLVPVPPDPDALRRIARDSGGQAFEATDAQQLEQIYERLGDRVGTKTEPREISAGFAGGALLLLAAGVGLGLRGRGTLP